MTRKLWQEILLSLDMEMQKENKKIILFVDNGSCIKENNLQSDNTVLGSGDYNLI